MSAEQLATKLHDAAPWDNEKMSFQLPLWLRDELILFLTRRDGPNDVEKRLRHQIEAARSVINRGVDLMTTEQVGQWAGVRSWLEQDENDYEPFATSRGTS